MVEVVFAAAAILGFSVLAFRHDRLRAQTILQRAWLEAHLAKALGDKRHMVRIPAESLAKVFKLKTRTLPDPSNWNRKPGQPFHPKRRKP